MTGRIEEQRIINALLKSDSAEMLAVIGRRRIGKTYLINNTLKQHIAFKLTGVQSASKDEQLQNFSEQLLLFSKSKVPVNTPKNWLEAFSQLQRYLSKKRTKQKHVIFFDELPWLASQRSRFLEALAYFWNNWGSTQPIILVICGSAASWMIDKVVHHKGSLHNRITRLIHLESFTLLETETYLKSRHIKLNKYQISQLYMVMGGVPHYLKAVEPGKSVAQNIDAICFKKHGLLTDEFSKLYAALFKNSDNHIAIIRALAKTWKGLTRDSLIKLAKLKDGGTFTKLLIELETSGFIASYLPFGNKKKQTLFRLTDEYSLFYLRFIESNRKASWQHISASQTWISWSGYAFESLCLKHSTGIKRALGIEGINSEVSSFVSKSSHENDGFQIDMLIDRADNTITVCEMKFYASEFIIDKAYAHKLRQKITGLARVSKTKKQIFLAFVSTYGLHENTHKLELVQNDITLDALFT
jgi:AAA+ ATPase superfamily predicted ATPase